MCCLQVFLFSAFPRRRRAMTFQSSRYGVDQDDVRSGNHTYFGNPPVHAVSRVARAGVSRVAAFSHLKVRHSAMMHWQQLPHWFSSNCKNKHMSFKLRTYLYRLLWLPALGSYLTKCALSGTHVMSSPLTHQLNMHHLPLPGRS